MQKMLIGGHLVGAEEWLAVLNPYTGEPVDHVARGGAVHVDQAVALARHGAEKMREMSLSQRAAILRHVAELIRQERGALATLLTQETGKLIGESRIEVERAAMVFELAAEACHHPRAMQFPPESFTDGASRFGFWAREPMGVVASILAFNLPLAHAAQKTAPAIAAGNAVILKPSTEAPLTVLRLGLLLYRAGMPPESLSILTGKRRRVRARAGGAPAGADADLHGQPRGGAEPARPRRRETHRDGAGHTRRAGRVPHCRPRTGRRNGRLLRVYDGGAVGDLDSACVGAPEPVRAVGEHAD
jgi:acyl-CoA reductase-like NAD-dependent aldehyde dehydrogenase